MNSSSCKPASRNFRLISVANYSLQNLVTGSKSSCYLKGQPEGLVGGTRRGEDGVEGFDQALAVSLAFFPLDGPPLEPGHLVGGLQHVVSVPSGDRDESHGGGVVADLLDVRGDFLFDFLETGLKTQLHIKVVIRLIRGTKIRKISITFLNMLLSGQGYTLPRCKGARWSPSC